MTMKNGKAILFASLIVALILPFSALSLADAAPNENANDKAENKTKQIALKSQSVKEKQLDKKAKELFTEKYDLDKKVKSEKTDKRLKEILKEIEKVNQESENLYKMTGQEKQKFKDAKKILNESDIPIKGLGIDSRDDGALTIGFFSQAEADIYIPQIDEIINVPYYIELKDGYDVDLSGCKYLTSDCDPLMGGIKISTQQAWWGNWTQCSISVPIMRGSDQGFITAAHCFNNNNGMDVKQPTTSGSKIGDVTVIQNGGTCDCAFVKQVGSEDTIFGNWWGISSPNTLSSKSDPVNGRYVSMIGYQSGVQVGKIFDDDYDTNPPRGTPKIYETMKVSYAMAGGDSGGTVIDLSASKYQGLIKAGTSSYTVIIPWTHIDDALDVN